MVGIAGNGLGVFLGLFLKAKNPKLFVNLGNTQGYFGFAQLGPGQREVVLLVRGRVLACGNVREIRGHIERHPHTIVCRTADARRIGEEAVRTSGLMGLELADDGRAITIKTRNPAEIYELITAAVEARRVAIETLMERCPDLAYAPGLGPERIASTLFRGMLRMPVRRGARAA